MNPQWSDEVKEQYTKDQEFYAECSARGIQIRLNTDTLELEGHMIRKPVGITAPYRERDYKEPRKWAGLTDDELPALAGDNGKVMDLEQTRKFYKAIERLLKEKNA